MTPSTILTAIRIGEHALNKHHKALVSLWRKFGAAVRSERRRRGISVASLAKQLGVSSAFVCMMESGARPWTVQKAEKVIGVLGTRHPMFPDCPVGPNKLTCRSESAGEKQKG
jgi:ribosome-binding protein aMBF1 (putative translation factor)